MARGPLTKVDILSRVLKAKKGLYEKTWYHHWDDKERKAADEMLNNILDIINEYSQ